MKTSHESNIQVLMVQNKKLKQDVVISDLEVQLEFATHDVSKANSEKENAIKNQRTDNMELRGRISVAQNTVETLEGDLATMGAEKEGLAKEKEQLRVKLEAKEKEYNTTVASNDKAHALKEKEFKKVCAEKEELTSAKEQLEDELKVNERKYNTAVASHENELTAKGEEVTQLQLQLARHKKLNATACRQAMKEIRKRHSSTVDDDDDSDDMLDGDWDLNWDHTGDTYDVVTGDLTRKVLNWSPNNRYPPKLPFCKGKGGCKKRGCRGPKFAECGKIKYGCAGGCGCQTYGSEDAFWLHVTGNGHQKGCLSYARKFSNHIAACEVKGINNYQTFRLKKNEEDAQEASVNEWLNAS